MRELRSAVADDNGRRRLKEKEKEVPRQSEEGGDVEVRPINDVGEGHAAKNEVPQPSFLENIIPRLRNSRIPENITVSDQENVSKEPERTAEPAFDPPLRTEVVYTSTYVNVDCSTKEGIDRGIAKNLATSNMIDVIYSPNIRVLARLFAPPVQAYGRPAVIIRNPIERAVAKYEYLKGKDTHVKKMTLEKFAKSDYLEDNVLTKGIAGRNNLAVAKETLKRQFVVGLYDRMEESFERFEIFFGWNAGNARTCQHNDVGRIMDKHRDIAERMPTEGSAALAILMEKNDSDMALYEFARFLFDYQGQTLFGIPPVSMRMS